MGNRFLRSVFLSDMAALVVGILAGSWSAFGTPAIWTVSPEGGGSVWTLVGLLAMSATIASYVSFMSWADVAPRPSYGRAFGIVAVTVALTAVGLVVARTYWSRQFLVVTVVPVSWFLVRPDPEAEGWAPDGIRRAVGEVAPALTGLTFNEAVATKAAAW